MIVALQFLHYQLYQESLKGFFYSVKLKLELNILSKLVDLVDNNARTNRSKTLEAVDSNAIMSPQDEGLNPLQREISPPPMAQLSTGWNPGYDSKAILEEEIKEDGRTDQPSASSSSSKPFEDEGEFRRVMSQSQQSTMSSRTKGRESDRWYAEMLRDIK